MTNSLTLTARWVFPAVGPPLPNGTVTIRGETIEAVERSGVRSPDQNLGNAAIVPGLVNAHTHLDLSACRGRIPPTDPDRFADWLRAVIAYRRTCSPERVRADVSIGLEECLAAGTTLIGDISADGGSWDAIAAAQTRAVVFRELIGLSESRARAARAAAEEWYGAHAATPTCRPALSPHSPYSARRSLLLGEGLPNGPVAIHLAESPGEMELVASHSGPFVSFLQEVGAWDETGLVRSIREIVAIERAAQPMLFVHGNYLPGEFARDFAANTSLVYCPRTHAAFGHPTHPFREFLACGVRVCLGTDSLASNPDLDVLAEARFIHRLHPDLPGEVLLRMATLAGAEALGWGETCGSLEAGKSADLVAVPLPEREGEPYGLLFQEHSAPRRTMFRGSWRAGD